ncbi:Arginine N-succinyltransferase [Saliniradius amylolyticus]|uniref:Arginine N-succinyltransferase n=2 Tax=Saliniradius amylolyticus TaxID=2183582 RepID=A0A2S2E2X5_9ALTE|nr:Arginine N-succinyltransferase [Saliniradius amylolyticus]
MPYTQPQVARTLVMVPPLHFAYNNQTGKDNAFQQRLTLSQEEVRGQAMAEFSNMVDTLRGHHIDVVEMAVPADRPKTPDAVFPNNWFTTGADGELSLFPMATENRRQEVYPDWLQQSLLRHGFTISETRDIRDQAAPGVYLEGTGALVFDHIHKQAYAAISQRCHRQLGERYVTELGYQFQAFETQTQSGKPVYHTNVMMSIGERFAVVCPDVIEAGRRDEVIASLAEQRELILLSENQINQMCGNVLEVENEDGKRYLLMSQTAYYGFTERQRQTLSQYATILPIAVPTIEQVGGGSVRCMVAEVFLPKKQAVTAKAS